MKLILVFMVPFFKACACVLFQTCHIFNSKAQEGLPHDIIRTVCTELPEALLRLQRAEPPCNRLRLGSSHRHRPIAAIAALLCPFRFSFTGFCPSIFCLATAPTLGTGRWDWLPGGHARHKSCLAASLASNLHCCMISPLAKVVFAPA